MTQQPQNQQDSAQFEKARDLLTDYETGMLITKDHEGRVHSRPMMLAAVDNDANLSFVTSISGEKVEEVLRDSQVGVSLQKDGAFVALSGHARVENDPEKKREVWSKGQDLWFDGPDDQRAALIQVVPERLEYWDNRGINSFKHVFQAIVAKAQDERPRHDTSQHGYVRMDS